MSEVPALFDVLQMLACGVGVGAVIAFLFEHISWFRRLNSEAKWWIIFILSLGLPLAAEAAIQFVPPDVLAQLEPWWQALAAGFLTWAGSQVAHKLFNWQG